MAVTPSRKPGRIMLATLLVAAAALFLVVWFSSRDAAPVATAASVAPAAAASRSRPSLLAAIPPTSTHPPTPPPEAEPELPIIDEVRVEKQEVCEGEENLITIKAHTPAGRDDAFLHYLVGTTPGQSVPLRAYLPAPGADVPGPMQVQVFGRGNASASVPVPAYTVKRCRPERALFLQTRQMPNSTDEYEFTATVRDRNATAPLRVTSYRWLFGDGSAREVSPGPSAVHRFSPRNPDTLFSDFLITCEAVGGDGRTVVGRTSLSLRNTEFENLHFQKTLVLSVELTPRFPQMDSAGQVTQTVRLYHHRSAPVRLQQVRVTTVEGADGVEPPVVPRSAGEVLGTEEVPPGHGVERKLRFDTTSNKRARMVNYAFEGHTTDGTPAIANFSLMVPPPAPTPESGARISDALLQQKILRARERLGKPFVNDEDLRQLERDGAFADLTVAAATGEPAAPAELPPAVVEAAIAAKRRPAP